MLFGFVQGLTPSYNTDEKADPWKVWLCSLLAARAAQPGRHPHPWYWGFAFVAAPKRAPLLPLLHHRCSMHEPRA